MREDLDARVEELEEELDALQSRVDTIGKCAAKADKNRELINSFRRVVGQLGSLISASAMMMMPGDRVMRQIPDEANVDAVRELHPADKRSGG